MKEIEKKIAVREVLLTGSHQGVKAALDGILNTRQFVDLLTEMIQKKEFIMQNLSIGHKRQIIKIMESNNIWEVLDEETTNIWKSVEWQLGKIDKQQGLDRDYKPEKKKW